MDIQIVARTFGPQQDRIPANPVVVAPVRVTQLGERDCPFCRGHGRAYGVRCVCVARKVWR